jgi:hypothetical protein
MNVFGQWRSWIGRLGLVAILAFWVAGCATTKIDWNSRVGAYTFDQAVLELGPPDRSAELTDGTRVVEWLTSRGHSHGTYTTFADPYPFYFDGPRTHYYSASPSPDHYLRLTFNPEGKLAAWRRVYK